MAAQRVSLQNLGSVVTTLMSAASMELAKNSLGGAKRAEIKVREAYETLIRVPGIWKADIGWINASGTYKERLDGMAQRFSDFDILIQGHLYYP